MEKLKMMKEKLINCVEQQLDNLSAADTKELGEAVDMIKDLEETIYYATVTKAMNESGRDTEAETLRYPSRYYGTSGRNMGGSRSYYEPYYYGNTNRMYYDGWDRGSKGNISWDYDKTTGGRDYMPIYKDYREGKSGASRRMYMESKEMHDSKDKQMHELETYMHELNQDIMEMINDATTEEKQILSQKLSTLADKIK